MSVPINGEVVSRANGTAEESEAYHEEAPLSAHLEVPQAPRLRKVSRLELVRRRDRPEALFEGVRSCVERDAEQDVVTSS